ASGEVSSQRKPSVHEDTTHPAIAALAGWEPDDLIAPAEIAVAAPRAEPALVAPAASAVEVRIVAPPPSGVAPTAVAPTGPSVIEVTPAITARPPVHGDAAGFLGAVRAEAPRSFGDLLDAA